MDFFGLRAAGNREINVMDYGAVSDGNTLNTAAIQKAIDIAYEGNGGKVLIPAGRFLSGSIVLKSNVELHLQEGAVLLGTTDPFAYKKLNRWKALLLAEGQENIAVTGKGTIDGQGRRLALNVDSLFYVGQLDSSDYNLRRKRPNEGMRTQNIEMVRCKNIRISGVTIKNAANWVQTYDLCENLVIDSVTVDSDAYWNNDGMDISDCKNVRITNCFVNSADDGICLKSHHEGACNDSIYIANCTVRSSASAIKFGTASVGGFRNIRIENIKVYDTFRSAIALETVDGGFLENVRVKNIEAVNTANAIFIRLGHRRGEKPGTLRNVHISDMKVQVPFERPDYKYDIRGPELPFFHNPFPASITGIPWHNVENITLENIEITYPGRGNNGLAILPLNRLDDVPENKADYPEFHMFGELPAWAFYIRHASGLTMKNIIVKAKAPDYRPAIVFDDVINLKLNTITVKEDVQKKQVILFKTQNAEIDNITFKNIQKL
ncbi:glycoside hydrolase family 28 protein [candidate division KSB1 bacterium]|nr:glycoside hydrolase family 28 protein [candidate division KSB1 bacterium]